jgi:TATA-box binding protein (TBP) (component of TFIID and TFIIIB)
MQPTTESNDKLIDFKATNLTISTCTVITNLNSKVNLGYLSRFINVYDQNASELNEKHGGVYNLEFYGNCARGETLIDKIKDEFNNQATIKFKYWGFRNINIKIFANGKLQMTGLKYEAEAKDVAGLLINILNKIDISLITNITNLEKSAKTYDFQLVYDKKTNKVFYYRKFYDRFMKVYNFDTNLVYGSNKPDSLQLLVNLKRKGFVKGIHDTYNDTIEYSDNNKDFLKHHEWSGDNYIKQTIDKIERLKEYFTLELEKTLTNSKNLTEVKNNMDILLKKFVDFKFIPLDKFLTDIGKNIFANDEQTLIDIKGEIFKFNKIYKQFMDKKVSRLITIRTIDITICKAVEDYLKIKTIENLVDNACDVKINIEDLELTTSSIHKTHEYFVSNTETVLINSDLSINHNIHLKRLSKVLKKVGLFNSYDPDEYPGVLTKYYYNTTNNVQGICNCPVHCSTKEKHSICTKITISVFRPGSVIITGARNLEQLKCAHELILKILKDNIHIIKGNDNEDDHKQIALLNNEFRKISRKPRLFYIKKVNIIDYPNGNIIN